ncbi:MAG: thiamine phosphate synthase [Sedimentisphaerales bacterium]|nr:thiamine phosphate synthase [Sedimentisphaerales bacterium]
MDKTALRIIDANFNRAREALRVIEEFARFVCDDAPNSQIAKQLRHDLCQIISQLPDLDLLSSRDTPGDVGTSIAVPTESARPDTAAVLQAALKRLPEALRCIEEYAKIDFPETARQIEKLRYRGYELEKQLTSTTRRRNRFANVRLYVLLTEKLCRLPILPTAQAVLQGGADCLQLREKEKSDRELLDLATQISKLCHDAGALFIMNDRPDLAILAGADGVHLGRDDLPVTQARKILPANLIVGTSTHNPTEVSDALAQQPDYLAVGSMFPSPTKPQVKVAGAELITEIRQNYSGPLIGIGGITCENAPQVIAAGASGIAICQAVIANSDPKTAAQRLKSML